MNRKSIIVALIISLGIAAFVAKKLQPSPSDIPVVAAPQEKMVKVVAAKRKIPSRTRLEPNIINDMIELKDIVASTAPPEFFTETTPLINKYTNLTLLPGTTITSECLLDKDAVPNLSFAIPPGRRAFTIQVTTVMGVAGFVQQGDCVDVIATFKAQGGGEATTKIILQDIQVLAVGKTYFQELDAGTASPTSTIMSQFAELITLAVTPEELERLVYIDSSGVQYRLVLKSPKDKDKKIVTEGATESIVRKALVDGDLAGKPAETSTGTTEFPPPVVPIPPVVTEPPPEVVVAKRPQIVTPSQPVDDGRVVIINMKSGSDKRVELTREGYNQSEEESGSGVTYEKGPTPEPQSLIPVGSN